MEYAQSGDLAHYIRKGKDRNVNFPEEIVWSFFLQLVRVRRRLLFAFMRAKPAMRCAYVCSASDLSACAAHFHASILLRLCQPQSLTAPQRCRASSTCTARPSCIGTSSQPISSSAAATSSKWATSALRRSSRLACLPTRRRAYTVSALHECVFVLHDARRAAGALLKMCGLACPQALGCSLASNHAARLPLLPGIGKVVRAGLRVDHDADVYGF